MALSELQLSLVALGTTVVVAIWGYNAWQARRQRKFAESLVKRESADVLLGSNEDVATGAASPASARTPFDEVPAVELSEGRLEPTLGDLPPLAPTVAAVDKAAVLPVAAAPPVGRAPDAAVAEAEAGNEDLPLPAHFLSPAADYIAAFELLDAVRGDQVLQAQADVLRSLGKRVAWVGFDASQPAWEFCRSGAAYRRLRIGVQLADRHGPLNEAGLDSFYRAMQRVADEFTAVADLPPRRPALDDAQRLDRICAGVDIQVGVNVVSKGAPFAGTKIRALAEAAGMVIEADGAYVRRDDDGRLLYTLHAQDGVGFASDTMRSMSAHGLTFLLDVPRVANGDRVFNQMVEVAHRFAETLQGELVDDNRRPLTEQFLTPIRKQIGQYQATMAAHGLPAGSDVALRLFS